MVRKWIAFGLLLGFISFVGLVAGCGPQVAEEAAVETITVKGLATTTGAKGVKTMAVLADADVSIGKPAKDSEDLTEVATGKTGSDGTYIVDVALSKIQDDAVDGRVQNLMVVITKAGTTLGATIPSISIATQAAFAPPANVKGLMKQKIARKAFKKGIDPKEFDFNTNIERKFEDLTDYDPTDDTKFDKMAEAIKNSEDVMDEIATGLGIDTTVLAKLDKKALEYHNTYIEPIFREAFENKIEPDRDKLDEALTNMEKYMKDYALSLGLTEQQFMDLKNMHDQHMQQGMKDGLGTDDPAFKEIERRNMGNKMLDLFYAQYDAALTLAQASSGTRESFQTTNSARYNDYVASKEVIAQALRTKLNDTTLPDPRVIHEYLRLAFFEQFLFPPIEDMPTKEGEMTIEQMEQKMKQYKSSRILVYFMDTFFPIQKYQIFEAMGKTLQPIYRNRFENTNSDYYMGPEFWASNPTPTQIQDRLEKFKTALDTAINSVIKTPFENVFGVSDTTTSYINAFRILTAPPDAF